MPDERHSTMSDSEILTRIDAVKSDLGGKIDGLSVDVQGIRQDMTVWRKEFVAQAVYAADERTRAEIRRQLDDKHDELEKRDAELGAEIADLHGEATRKERDRRRMWAALAVTVIGAAASAVFSIAVAAHTTTSPPITVCVPTQQVACK